MHSSIGIDVESTEGFREFELNDDELFLKKVYTDAELDYCFNKENPDQHLAGRFAAKEAMYKAVEQIPSIERIDMTEIEIRRKKNSGPPSIYAPNMKHISSSLSISHTTEVAVAVVLLLERGV